MRLTAILTTFCFMLSGGLAGLMIVCHKQAALLSVDREDADRTLRGIRSLPGDFAEQTTQGGLDATERFHKAAPLDFRDMLTAASKLHDRMVSRKVFPGERVTQDAEDARLTSQESEGARLASQGTEDARLVGQGSKGANLASSAASFLQTDGAQEAGALARQAGGKQLTKPDSTATKESNQELVFEAVAADGDNGQAGEGSDRAAAEESTDGEVEYVVVQDFRDHDVLLKDPLLVTDMIDAISQTEDDFDNPTSLAALSNSLAVELN